MADSLESLKGIIVQVHEYNPDDGWGYGMLKADSALINFNGTVSGMYAGMHVQMAGVFVANSKYGEQFKMVSYIDEVPKDMIGVLTYFEHAKIKGIGKRTARKLVDYFKEDLVYVLDYEPDRLVEVPGVGTGRAEEIKKNWAANAEKRDMYIQLHGYGISKKLADKLHDEYGVKALGKVRENPYMLADEIDGVGFMQADNIAFHMGFDMGSTFRYMAMVKYALKKIAAMSGSCYAEFDVVREFIVDGGVLNMNKEREYGTEDTLSKIFEAVRELVIGREIARAEVNGVEVFALMQYVRAEKIVARRLAEIVREAPSQKDNDALLREYGRVISRCAFKLSSKQEEAVKNALTGKLTVVTGGPGVGKTTILKVMLDCFEGIQGMSVGVCAPTGRAARRVQEMTGRKATTIHRLLEYNPITKDFYHNETQPLGHNVLIIEESSMIDVMLMASLMSAVDKRTRVIIVGDVDQLPSVGAGDVLADIIRSGIGKVTVLDTIFRQKDGSSIVSVAHAINDGEAHLRVVNNKESDICFIRGLRCPESTDIAYRIQQTILNTLPSLLKKYSIEQVQILTPQKKEFDPIGSVVLNREVQALINPYVNQEEHYIVHGKGKYALGDRVMHIKNNYNLGSEGIFNGDIGKVVAVDKDESVITVEYPEQGQIEYSGNLLDELTLSYACTVHKSQGSEYPVVIIPCSSTHRRGFTRKLLYTATTRGKQLVIFIGEDLAFQNAIADQRTTKRVTLLKEHIKVYGEEL